MHLHVSCSLKFLKDNLIHAASSVNQSGSHNGQRTAFLNVSCSPKETLRLMQSVCVYTAG